MDLQEQLRQLSLANAGKVNKLVNGIQNASSPASTLGGPPPQRKVPQSKIVPDAQEPLYSRPLQNADMGLKQSGSSILLRKRDETPNGIYCKTSKSTLDNPAVLEQQLEALAYHKQQMEKKGLLGGQQLMPKARTTTTIPKLSSTSLIGSDVLYSNLRVKGDEVYKNIHDDENVKNTESIGNQRGANNEITNVYANFMQQKQGLAATLPKNDAVLTISTNPSNELEDELPPPPSPVSSSYSELRRATDVFAKANANKVANATNDAIMQPATTTMNNTIYNDYSTYLPSPQSQQSQNSSDYYGYGCSSQNSSAYDSIYEPINPRPPSAMSSHSNYLMYASYVNGGGQNTGSTTSANLSTLANINTSGTNTPIYASGGTLNSVGQAGANYRKENEVETLTDLLVHSMNPTHDVENYGICFKCNERVLGENNGCTAMDQIYHIACFTCWQCQINLQGKPFYALEGKPYCEYDYLQTLEKCSVCMKPILERILRATGKPYHPQCFTCVVCGNSLDGIPFTVDATNQNYCITDFHKKFAPRCCVCKEPIMPETGQEETIRVVALDRSFHLECYKCEDCGLLLSSEAEGRGCYPLDDHVLCKSCNAKRVQVLTNRMTTEL